MSNGGSFVPLSIPKQPPVGLRIGVDPSDKSYVSPMSSSTNVVASKSAPGHVVAAPAAGNHGGQQGEASSRYKWHTVVDGFSK